MGSGPVESVAILICAPSIYPGLCSPIGFENMVHGPQEFLGSFYFGFEKRDYSSKLISENLVDFSHVLVLHFYAVEHEFGGIRSHLVLLNKAVYEHSSERNSEFI